MYYLELEYESIPALKTKTDFINDSKKLLSIVYDYYNDPKNATIYIK